MNKRRVLLFVVNVDWYFLLHWVDRALAAQDAGYDVCIATNISSEANAQKLRAHGFKVYGVPFARNTMNMLGDIYPVLCLWNAIRKAQPEIMHCVTIKPVVYGGLLNWFQAKPCVASIVGLGSIFAGESLRCKATWWLLSKALTIAVNHKRSLVTFENSHDRDVFVRRVRVTHGRTDILPGAGVDLHRFRYSPETTEGTLNILFASRLLKSKGLELLVQATDQLNSAGISTALHVAGIEDLESKDPIPLSKIRAWQSQGKLVWHGNVKDVERMIASSNVVCLPTSYGEGIPRILIEAAACGRAVVSTLVPGCREFVHDGIDGLLVPTGDVSAFAEALRRLAADPEGRARMGLAGRRKVREYYSNAVVAERTLACYSTLLGDIS